MYLSYHNVFLYVHAIYFINPLYGWTYKRGWILSITEVIGYLLFVGGEVPPNLTRSTARRPSAESYWVSNEGHPSPPHTINTICLKGAILTSSFFILKCQWSQEVFGWSQSVCVSLILNLLKRHGKKWREESLHTSVCMYIHCMMVYVTCIYSSLRHIMVSSVDSTLVTMI